MDGAPFIAVSRTGERTTVRGTTECSLGRPVDEGGVPGGVFARWRWDGETLEVVNDRYGFYPLFFWARRGSVSISPSPLALLAEGGDSTLDYGALAVFLRLGFFLGEETPWQAIRALPPACRLFWREGRTEIRSEGRFKPQPSSLTRSEGIDAFTDAVTTAMGRRRPQTTETVLPLSGGADSRHILAELLAAGINPRCVTARYFPNRPNHDAEVAAEITVGLGLNHDMLDQPESELAAEIRKNEVTGYCADEHAWFIAVADYLKSLPPVTIYDGLGGDVMTTTLFLNEEHLDLFLRRRLDELSERLMKNNERTLNLVLPNELRSSSTRDIAHARIAQELETHIDSPNPIGSFLFWNRTRREISYMSHGMLPPNVVAHTPFLDRGVVDLMTGLPAHYLLDRSFHREAIERAHLRFAEFRYAPKRAPRAGSRSHIRRYARELTSYWLRRAPAACRPTMAAVLAIRAVDGANKKGLGLAAYLVGLARRRNTPGSIAGNPPEKIKAWT